MLDLMAQGRDCCGLPAPSEQGVPGNDDPRGICVCELQENLGLAQSKVSYHLRVLKEAGLITSPPSEIPFLLSFFQKAVAWMVQQGQGKLQVPTRPQAPAE